MSDLLCPEISFSILINFFLNSKKMNFLLLNLIFSFYKKNCISKILISLSYYYLKSQFSKILFLFFVENLISILILNFSFLLDFKFMMYIVFLKLIFSSIIYIISFYIMKIGLLILLFILENVNNGEL